MADQFTGKNLAITIEGDPVTCPQSFEVNGQHEFVEFYCVGTAGKQRTFDGTNWTASCTWFPEDNDHADLTDFNNVAPVAILVYPDGNTAGKIRVSFSAFSSVGLTTQRSSVGSSTVNFIIDGDVTFDAVPA
jgi:hypothetical protein